MPSQAYEKAEAELNKLIQLEKNLSEVNTKLLEGREVLDTLGSYIEKSVITNVPILREYLKDLIEIRMTFSREVLDILRSSNELGKVTKVSKDLLEFAEAIEKIKTILTPETIEILRKVIK